MEEVNDSSLSLPETSPETISNATRKVPRRALLPVSYRAYHSLTSPKVPPNPAATEMLKAKFLAQHTHEKLLTMENRIRKLREQEEKVRKASEKLERERETMEKVRERRLQEQMEKDRLRSDRQAAEVETRLRNLREKRNRMELISTAKSRLFREKKDIVEQTKVEKEQLERVLEEHKEHERRMNLERRIAMEKEIREEKQKRQQTSQGFREHVKSQYQSRVDTERQKAEEDERRLKALETEEQLAYDRYRATLTYHDQIKASSSLC